MSFDKIGIVGAGSWGTALAFPLADNDARDVGYDAAHIDAVKAARENKAYLPGVALPAGITPTASLDDLADAGVVLLVTPSRNLHEVLDRLVKTRLSPDAILLSCTKGIEQGSGLRMSELVARAFPRNPVAVLSGPSHAEEVARRLPTAVVVGSADETAMMKLQQAFSTKYFRAYTSTDVAGIELGGALKNIFAIAAGMVDGMGLGDNTKAALVTRSLAELVRMGIALGGRRETFQGLSGIGDLVVTCFSKHSRNRGFGERLGRGETCAQITGSMKMVAEGVPNTLSAYECSRRFNLDTPIIDQIYAVLYENKSPQEAMHQLLTRDPRPEED